jgi:hypothetical protein
VRGLLVGHGVEDADGVTALGAAGDLRGPQDRGVVRRVRVRRVVLDEAVELWRPTDAA